MIFNHKTFLSIGTAVALSAGASAAHANNSTSDAPDTIKVMSYNVQNLFDTVHEANMNDSEFTPRGEQKWTDRVLQDKIRNLGAVIESQNPDILGMAEVENQQVLEQLVRGGLKATSSHYNTIVTADTDDGRGIRTALISKFPATEVKSHSVAGLNVRDSQGSLKHTRQILEVTLDTGAQGEAGLVTVLVNHWPARSHDPSVREAVAQEVTRITKSIVEQHPGRLVVAMGDFNDELSDRSMSQGLTLVDRVEDLANKLASFFPADLDIERLRPEERGTFYFHPARQWNSLDHILVSEGADLARGTTRGYHYEARSLEVVREKRFAANDGTPQGCEIIPQRNIMEGRQGDACPRGASDHRPLVATFGLR